MITQQSQKKQRAERLRQYRKELFPEVHDTDLWEWKGRKGWINLPRPLPIFLRIMNALAPKNNPVASTYLELFCRTMEEPFVELENHKQMAFHAGFEGQRGVRTWAKRVKILSDLGFIKLKAGPNGDLSFALLLNPYLVIERHFKKKSSELEALRTAFYARIKEVGAPDLTLAAEMRRKIMK